MKKLLAVILLVMVLPYTGYAAQITVNNAGIGANTSWTIYGNSTGGFAGQIDTSLGELYCAELGQNVYPGGVYNYTVVANPTLPYITAMYILAEFGASADTASEAAGLQAAIWEAIYGANFTLNDGDPLTIGTIAYWQAQYLVHVNNYSKTAPAGYALLDLGQNQDLITRVPEPMTMILLGLGLVGLAGLRRKE
jgi:hypothetical protein